METFFYYHKDKYGGELCYPVEDIQEDAKDWLSRMGNDASVSVDYLTGEDFAGYKTIDEYIQNEGEDSYALSIKEGLESGLSYPFCLVHHSDGEIEPLKEDKVDYLELFYEYTDFGRYRILPSYYGDDDLTPEEAQKEGKYELASYLKGTKNGN